MSVENQYSIGTVSMVDHTTLKPMASWTIGDHVRNARTTGYNGVELWPQGPIPRIQIATGLISQAEKDGITSTHQSVGKGLIESALRFDKRETFKAAVLPGSVQSLTQLEKVKGLVDRDIPVVLFNNLPEGYLDHTSYTQTGIQTAPELCDEIGASNAEEFVEAIKEIGFGSVVIDTHHIRRPNVKTGEQNPLADWRRSIPVLLPHTKEIHIGLGRADYGGISEDKIGDELKDFLNKGSNNTEITQMMRLVADLGWGGLVVMELRPYMIKKVLEQKGFQLTERNLQVALNGMRDTLYDIFDK